MGVLLPCPSKFLELRQDFAISFTFQWCMVSRCRVEEKGHSKGVLRRDWLLALGKRGGNNPIQHTWKVGQWNSNRTNND